MDCCAARTNAGGAVVSEKYILVDKLNTTVRKTKLTVYYIYDKI